MSCVSTTVPTCTDRTEVAPKITPSVRACDTKRVRAQHFIRRRAAGGSPAALLCVSSEVSHCAGQVVLEGLRPPLRTLGQTQVIIDVVAAAYLISLRVYGMTLPDEECPEPSDE